jgi:hypothetical protein
MHESNGIQQDPQSHFHKQTPTVRANSSPQFGMLQRGMTEKLHCTLFWSWSLPPSLTAKDDYWTTWQAGQIQGNISFTLNGLSHMIILNFTSEDLPEYFFFNIPADIWLQNSSSEITPEYFFCQHSN